MKALRTLQAHISRLILQPVDELTRLQRSARYTIELVRYCALRLARDNASQLAAALTYRTIFSLVPTVVLSLIAFQAFNGFEQNRDDLQVKAFEFFGLTTLEYQEEIDAVDAGDVTNDTEPEATSWNFWILPSQEAIRSFAARSDAGKTDSALSVPEAPYAGAPETEVVESVQLRTSITWVIQNLASRMEQVSFRSIGVVGLVLLIWGALALAVTVEQSFNQVLGCNVGRPWHRRIAIYWTVLSLGPVLVVTSLYVAGQIQAWIEQNAGMVTGWMPPLGRFTGVMASWTLFFLLYQLMPNTRVKLRASILGALIAALMWEAAKWAFNLYVTRAVPFSALYGSLGLIPLFLFWLYLSWLIVLFGLELTNALQVVGTIRMYEQMPDKRRPFCDPHAVIPLMAAMADSFDRGVAVSREHMALKLGLPLSATDELLQRLRQAGLIFEVDGRSDEPPRYALAQSPRRIRLVDLLILARTFTTNVGVKTPGGECMLALQAAQDAAVEGKTLADLVQDAVAPAEVNAQPT